MEDSLKKIESYPEVSFIDNMSFSELQSQMISDYEAKYKEITGRNATLARADPYRMILYSCAVAVYQGYQYGDRAGKMGLLKYSYGSFLDNLAALKGVKRNEAFPARAEVRFTLSAILDRAAVVPKGTRVKAADLYFETTEKRVIEAGKEYGDVTVWCQTVGAAGNGFMPGEIRTLVDPLPYTFKVENITQTGGGTDTETDRELADRVFLAPSGYSTAGPQSAYAYWIKTFNPAVGECRIVSEKPGEVDIYIVMEDGSMPDTNMISELTENLTKSEIRPLTDHVVVRKPEEISYDIDLTYFIPESSRDMEDTIKQSVKQACDSFILWQKRTGRDIDPSQLIFRLAGAGAVNITIRSPVFAEVCDSEIAIPNEVSLAYGGLKND